MKRTLFLLFLILFLCSCHHYEIERYDPPMLTVVAETGEHVATRFGYRWELERKEDAVDYVDPRFYEEYVPIVVKEGETCRLRFSRGYAPEMYIIQFFPEDGGEKQIIEYSINRYADDPQNEEEPSVSFTVTGSGIYTVDAVWPEWITNSLVTDATYGFAVTVSGRK